MNAQPARREFLLRCAQVGFVCASTCGLATALAAEETKPARSPDKLPPLRARAYCGLVCGSNCPLHQASVANDDAGKKEVYEKWGWREKYGIEFDAAKVFCFGCKPDGKPRGRAVSACTTRECATDRGLESCLQCRRLATCDKELWKSWGKFREQMLRTQQDYVTAGAFTLV